MRASLHRQVRALHQPDLDPRAAARRPRRGPLLQALHRSERVRQVSLEDYSGFKPEQLVQVQQLREHRDREVEVAVLLHVEVDELLRVHRASRAEQGEEPLADLLDDLAERPWRVGRDRGRDLE
jgi:hypothetical protein